MPIYMQYGDIKGTVTESGHDGWIELTSFQYGVGRSVASPTGGVADRESSAPRISEITCTKENDAASTPLLQEALTGDGGGKGAKVTFDFVRTNAGKLTKYQTVTIYNVIISGYSVSSAGDRPNESFSLNFTKLEVTTTQMNPDGSEGSPITVGYDIAKATTT